jgi:hypothetical protein
LHHLSLLLRIWWSVSWWASPSHSLAPKDTDHHVQKACNLNGACIL